MVVNGLLDSLPKTQRAAQFSPKTNSISVNTIPIPKPTKDQLLIKVASASLCHSDLMLFEPNETGLMLGDGRSITIGHEATGVILFVPESCTDSSLKVGTKIGFLCPEDVCYECPGCQIHNSWCKNGKTIMSGFGRDGFFQEYVTSHWRNAIVLPDELDLYEAAPLFCAGVTSWQGVTEAKINLGEWMAIVGCGGLGHLGLSFIQVYDMF
jgi:D-arabinose 1-dehydrogenase-like Zn-dependent alcohol dehydrogenase